jgi:anti-sigma regulatory factor (Ser/Thr protein kinase)
MGGLCSMTDSVIEEVKLAVDEACANVIKHAYRGDVRQKIVVKFALRKRDFEVIIEDNGIKARPELIAGRNLEEVRPGGLGIHFIKRTFDVFQFDEKKTKGNRLRLIRHIGGGNEDRNLGQ